MVRSNHHRWMVLGHGETGRILEDHQALSNRVSRHLSIPSMDLPEHTVYRQLIEPFFAPEAMAAFEPRCRGVVDGRERQTDRPHAKPVSSEEER